MNDLLYELKSKARQAGNKYGVALCETMLAFFRETTPAGRASLLWEFAKAHGHEPGHDMGKWSKLIRFVEETPVPRGVKQLPADMREAE